MMRISASTLSAKTFLARLTSQFMVLAFLVALETQLISPVSAEVTFLNHWGGWGSGDGELITPHGIAVSGTGQIYVGERNDRIQRFDADGNYEIQWNTGDGQLYAPTNVALSDSGQVYVVNGTLPYIQRFDVDGTFETKWGDLWGNGDGEFQVALGIAVSDTNQVYVVDQLNHRIQRFDADGNYEIQWGSEGTAAGQFDNPYGIAVSDTGQIYVADLGNDRIQRFDAEGNYETQWGSNGSGHGEFSSPSGIAVAGTGQIYVVDRNFHRIQRFDADGNYETQWGSEGIDTGQFDNPYGIAVSDTGEVYVTDRLNSRIQRFFDSDVWISGTNSFVESSFGPTSIAVGPGDLLGVSFVLNAGKELIVGDTLTVNTGGALSVNGGSLTTSILLLDGGTFAGPDLSGIDTFQFNSGTFNVTGPSGLTFGGGGPLSLLALDSSDALEVANTTTIASGGSLSISGGSLNTSTLRLDGGTFSGPDLAGIDTFEFISGTLNVTGPSGLTVSNGGPLGASVMVAQGQTMTVDNTTTIGSESSLSVSGGSLSTSALLLDGGAFQFNTGTLNVTGPSGLTVGAGGLLGESVVVAPSQSLIVDNTTMIPAGGSLSISGGSFNTSELLLDGGTFAGPDLSGIDTFQFNSGTLNVTGPSGLVVSSGAQISLLTLNSGDVLEVSDTTTIASGGSLSVSGGSMSTSALLLDGGTFVGPDLSDIDTFHFNSGTLTVTGLTGLTVGEGGPFNSLALNSGDILSVDNTTTITAGGTLSMSGGALSTSALLLDGGKFRAAASDFADINTFQFNSGTLNVTGPSGLTVGADGPLGGLVVIANNQELIVDNTTKITSGHSLSISGGSLNTSTLRLDGGTFSGPDLAGIDTFEFISGTLNVTGPSGLTVSNGGPLGASVMVAQGQTMTVDNTTTIGSESSLSVSGGSLSTSALLLDGGAFQFNTGTLNVTGPSGLTVGADGPLGSLTLNAGDVLSVNNRATISPDGELFVSGGTVSADSVINNNLVEVSSVINVTNAFTNNSVLDVVVGADLRAGTGLVNHGTIDLVGGSIGSPGSSVTNDFDGLINAEGTINADLNNNGTTRTTGVLVITGVTTNVGLIEIELSESIRPNGGLNNLGVIEIVGGTVTGNGDLNNAGLIELTGGAIASSGTVTNQSGGIMHGGGTVASVLANDGGLIHANGSRQLMLQNFNGNFNNGELRISDGLAMNVATAFSNDGTIVLGGVNATLTGGAIANSGTIKGAGRVVNAITNADVIRAEGGELTLAGSDQANTASGWIEARTGAIVLYAEGIADNFGAIALTGGGFDNGGNLISNTGTIMGHGEFRSGGLTNDGTISVGGGDLHIIGDVANNGALSVAEDDTVIFFNNVNGNGASGLGEVKFLQLYSPGMSPAEVIFGGNVMFAGTSTLMMELAGVDDGDYDQLQVAGILEVGGDLAVELLDDFVPAAETDFQIFDAGTLSGTFSAVLLPDLPGMLGWDSSDLYSSGTLSVIPEPATLPLLALGLLLAWRRR